MPCAVSSSAAVRSAHFPFRTRSVDGGRHTRHPPIPAAGVQSPPIRSPPLAFRRWWVNRERHARRPSFPRAVSCPPPRRSPPSHSALCEQAATCTGASLPIPTRWSVRQSTGQRARVQHPMNNPSSPRAPPFPSARRELRAGRSGGAPRALRNLQTVRLPQRLPAIPSHSKAACCPTTQ